MTWWDDAACVDYPNPDAFFPGVGEDTMEAKRICFRCPVRLQCLDHALRVGEKYGIWGGYSEKQRRVLRRQQRLNGVAS